MAASMAPMRNMAKITIQTSCIPSLLKAHHQSSMMRYRAKLFGERDQTYLSDVIMTKTHRFIFF